MHAARRKRRNARRQAQAAECKPPGHKVAGERWARRIINGTLRPIKRGRDNNYGAGTAVRYTLIYTGCISGGALLDSQG